MAKPLGFKNKDGRGFHYTPLLEKHAAKMGLLPITTESDLKKALAVKTKPARATMDEVAAGAAKTAKE